MKFSLGKLIVQYVGAFLLIGLGAYLIFRRHPWDGGLLTFVGLLAYIAANGRVAK
jgi:hypothetical protein